MTRRLFVLFFVIGGLLGAAIAPVSVAHAATHRLPLRAGSSSPVNCGVKWMTSGPRSHRPNIFTVAGTYSGNLKFKCDYFGPRLAAAVTAYKWRLGYPAKWAKPVIGSYFIALLHGTKTRPIAWIALAQQRVQLVEPGATKLALRIKAWEISQLGHAEINGSNCGPAINSYFSYLHLPCGLQWCEIFQANGFGHGGYLPVPFALGAVSPYGVISTEQWVTANHPRWLNAKPAVGSLAAFLDDGGHIGYVVKVTASGYVTIEGNESDEVKEVWHAWNDRLRVFIDLPGVA